MNQHWLTTDLGPLIIEWNDHGVTRLHLPAGSSASRCLPQKAGPARYQKLPDWLEQLPDHITQYFSGQSPKGLHHTPVDLRGLSSFACRTLTYIKEHIGIGQTISYGAIAHAIGSPQAARAVGRVMARNPVPLIIPCHRVIAANGALTGFSGGDGLATKRFLLQLEKIL